MISVCIATYNGGKFLKEQLESILSQLSANDEIIISDDGSVDDTMSIIYNFNDSRIKVFSHIPQCGYSNHQKSTSNFENALVRCSGDYIFLADQDDIWLPNKVSKCVQLLSKYDFIVHSRIEIDKYSNIISNVCELSHPLNWFSILIKMKWFGCCMAFRRNVLNIVLPFPLRLIAHDYWISIMAMKFCNCYILDEPLILYRKHDNSVSQHISNSLTFKILYRLKLLFQIISRSFHIKK